MQRHRRHRSAGAAAPLRPTFSRSSPGSSACLWACRCLSAAWHHRSQQGRGAGSSLARAQHTDASSLMTMHPSIFENLHDFYFLKKNIDVAGRAHRSNKPPLRSHAYIDLSCIIIIKIKYYAYRYYNLYIICAEATSTWSAPPSREAVGTQPRRLPVQPLGRE